MLDKGFSHIVLSPGPGRPEDPRDFSLGRAVFELGVPVLGVCLGMQALVTSYGGHVGQVEPAHGELAVVEHGGTDVFAGLPSPFTAVRYHSLAALALPDELTATALVRGRRRPGRDGGRAPRETPVGRAVPPRVDPHRARRAAGAHVPGAAVSVDPVQRFVELAATYDRMFWLDGGGSRAWSGRRSILGFLRDEDVSLTYDAAARQVSRHQHGRAEVVGDDVFAVLAAEVARDGGDPAVSWVGYLGYACRPDLPAHTGGDVPDAVWMRVRDPLFVDHPPGVPVAGAPRRALDRTTPGSYADAFAEVQRQLRLGNSYEVNLTYREAVTSAVDPVSAYLRLRASSPAPYAGFLRHHGTHLLSSSPERFALVGPGPVAGDQADQGHHAARRAPPTQDEAMRHALATDPKFRAENLMIVDLLRNDLSMVCDPGTVTRADADGGRVLRVGAPAGLDRPRPAASTASARSRRCARCSRPAR